jgi:hypothetical protein
MYYPILDRRLRGQGNGELDSSPHRTSTLAGAPTLHDTQETGVSHPSTLLLLGTLGNQRCNLDSQQGSPVQLVP